MNLPPRSAPGPTGVATARMSARRSRASASSLLDLLILLLVLAPTCTRAADRPNIVWILVDDMSPNFSCYGETVIKTPNVDRLAAEGTRFSRAFVTGPICSISRSALLTGCYQTAIRCQNHRSGSEKYPIHLPAGMQTVPERLKATGYHTSNLTLDDFLRSSGRVKIAKTDYNFVWDPATTYDTNHWAQRRAGQPFFVQIQLNGGKNRGQKPGPAWPTRVTSTLGSATSTNSVRLPPYLPEDDTIRSDWAQYLDCVRYTDWEVGRIVQKLQEAGELDRTVIVFWTDHGISHVRNKQFLYDGGLHVPLILRGPGIAAGRIRNELVEHIDIAAVTIALAGLPVPSDVQARNILAPETRPRPYVFAARDRADETVDRIRSVRSERFKYIRNFYPDRPYLQPNRYKDDKAIVQAMRRLHAEGKLNRDQALILAESRPPEEFYDLAKDPHELHNLADQPASASALAEHRQALMEWMARTTDHGRSAEPDEVYLNYIYDDRPEGGRGHRNDTFDRNVQLMRRWATERPMRP